MFRLGTSIVRYALTRQFPSSAWTMPAVINTCVERIAGLMQNTAYFTTKSGNSGRVLTFQKDMKKGKGIKLCAGCGAQVVRGTETGFKSGLNAVDPGLSKKEAKRARFYDSLDGIFKTEFFCDRCKALKDENIWKAYDALHDVEPSVFRDQVQHIVQRRRFGYCVLVVDATDPIHSAIKKLRDAIKKTPCLLVINKVDLVPRMSEPDLRALELKIQHISGCKFISAHGVSAKTGYGVVSFAERLLSILAGRDVFVVGCANVGKSSFVQKLASIIAESGIRLKGKKWDKRRELLSDLPVTGSPLPGTTLQSVRVPCFPSVKHALWDTPGIINRKALQYSLFPVHLMEPLARPDKIDIPSHENDKVGLLSAGYTLLIEAAWMEKNAPEYGGDDGDYPKELPWEPCVLGRIDVIDVKGGPTVLAKSYLHPSLRVRVVQTKDAPEHATVPDGHIKRVSKLIRYATKAQNTKLVENFSLPLKPHIWKESPRGYVSPSLNYFNENNGKFQMDICFASLGWISFFNQGEYTLKPWCVEKSVFSQRRALYPANLAKFLEQNDPEIEEEMDEEEISRRLRIAVDKGKSYRYGRDNEHGDDEFTYQGEQDYYASKKFASEEWF